jgi:DNA repair protein RecO
MYTTKAIVLAAHVRDEADELVSVYTQDFGKMTIRARGVRKATTKQGMFLHGFAVVRASFILGKGGGATLSGVSDVHTYGALSDDLYARGYVDSFLRLCNDVLYEGQADNAVWELLNSVLQEGEEAALNKQEDTQVLLWHKEKMWLLQLLEVFGMRPRALNVQSATNRKQLDAYLQQLLQHKFERPVSFLGLRTHAS